MVRLDPTAVLVGAAIAFAWAGCGAATPPRCDAATPCGEGTACVVGVCRALDADAVPADARRVVLDPTAVAVLEPRGGSQPLPVTPLGARGREDLVLLLRFDPTLGRTDTVEAAYLVLDRDAEAPADAVPIELEVAAAIEPWSVDRVRWTRPPRVGALVANHAAPAASDAPLRIDVTELVDRTDAEDLGFVLRATSFGLRGVRVVTGPARGASPRLELYLR